MKSKDARTGGIRDRVLHTLYEVGVWFKGIDGIIECIAGLLFLIISKAALNRFIVHWTHYELVEDPTDWFALHLRQAAGHLTSSTKLFASAYLLGHGVIKIFLVWGLLRYKLWAFPTAIAFLGAFIGYQSYRLMHRFSVLLVALTIIDIVVLLLIWREYKRVKQGVR